VTGQHGAHKLHPAFTDRPNEFDLRQRDAANVSRGFEEATIPPDLTAAAVRRTIAAGSG
jgi:hypothetical protein